MGKGRAPCCDKSKVKRGPWSPQEDLTLITFIQKHGHHNWRSLPKLAGLMRCGKSCRLRWINYLRPDVKRGNFTKEEEDAIIHFHQTFGNKWSKIASFLPGRTDNEIKNVWNTHLKKRLTPTSSSSNSSSHDQSKEANHDKNYGGIQEEAHSDFKKSQHLANSSHLQGQCPEFHELHEIELLLDYDEDFDYILSSKLLPATDDMLVREQPLDSLLHTSVASHEELTRRPQSSNNDHDITSTFEAETNREHDYDSWEHNEWFDNQTYLDDFTLFGEICP